MTQGENPNKFRNAASARLLKALFFEETREDKSNVLYTLKDRDHKGYPSLYRLYLEARDPLEYTFANTYLDGWEHWQMLCNCDWFQPYVERWRKELELIIRTEALLRLEADAKSTSRSSAVSNRYLLDGGWRESKAKGRPSKDEIKANAKRMAEHTKEQEADLQRLFSSPFVEGPNNVRPQ